jgi:ubiquitin-protein ligase
MTSTRTKRILRDFDEIAKCPVGRASACIAEDGDVGLWHGNISGYPDSPYEDITLHFSVIFPATYPIHPPRVVFATYVHHMNVIPTRLPDGSRGYEVCLDMLSEVPPNSTASPFVYWSPLLS